MQLLHPRPGATRARSTANCRDSLRVGGAVVVDLAGLDRSHLVNLLGSGIQAAMISPRI